MIQHVVTILHDRIKPWLHCIAKARSCGPALHSIQFGARLEATRRLKNIFRTIVSINHNTLANKSLERRSVCFTHICAPPKYDFDLWQTTHPYLFPAHSVFRRFIFTPKNNYSSFTSRRVINAPNLLLNCCSRLHKAGELDFFVVFYIIIVIIAV